MCCILADARSRVYDAAAALEGVGHRNQGKRFKNIKIIFHVFYFFDRCYSGAMPNLLRQQM